MEDIDIKAIKENDIVKFINPNNTLFDGRIIKVSNTYLCIKIDVKQNTYIELKKDQFIELILVYGHEAIKCSSVILGTKQGELAQDILISIPKFILKIQRREFQRIPIVMDLDFSPLPDGAEYKALSDIQSIFFRFFRNTHTIDISAGGMNFLVPKNEIDCKSALVKLAIKDKEIIILCSRTRTDAINDSIYNKVAFRYEDIKIEDRQLISEFVSEKAKEISKTKIV